jgi:hypothetical protein
MSRRSIAAAALVAISVGNGQLARAQAPAAETTSHKFEVASVKRSHTGGRSGGYALLLAASAM